MYFLHIETSTSMCSVALSHGPEVIHSIDLREASNHTARLAPAIEDLLRATGRVASDLRAVAVSAGPGSYTGLRVGASTAKAISYSLDIPLIGVPTLAGLAQGIFDAHPEAMYALPMLDARRMEVYTALYDRMGSEILTVAAVDLRDDFLRSLLPGHGKIVAGGDGAHKMNLQEENWHGVDIDTTIGCRAAHMAVEAFRRFEAHQVESALHFVPYYIKPPNITTPKNRQMS